MAEDNRIGEIRTRIAKISLREDGIVQMVVFPGAVYTLADTREGLAAIVNVSEGTRHPLLADARNLKKMDFAARQESATFKEVTSVAILIDSTVSRIIGNVFLTFNKMAFPIRLFSSEAEAIEWLKGFLE